MFNHPRRKSLKILSLSAVTAATGLSSSLQTFASSFSTTAMEENSARTALEPAATEITDVVFNIEERGFLGRTTLVLSNRSNTESKLKHVYPGIVHCAGKTFDLNTALQNGPIKLPAGATASFALHPVTGTATEQSIPKGLTYSRPVTVATPLKAGHSQVNPLQPKIRTLRTCFS